ncbi:MAG: efflux RND transporter periplasmic adaptor subunit, partial [Limnothrix sp. RL_2_0]|nr:efflux RND transporter periplasmic adaptor subunit [Limnothrix sp. RL_2_0]
FWSVVAGVTMGVSSCGKPPMPQGQAPMGVPVKFEILEEDILETVTEYVGVLEADQLVTLKSETDGSVQSILVTEGNFVEAGTPILRLKSERSQASLGQAIANVEAAKAAEINAKAQLSTVRAEKVEAEADLKLQEQDFDRIKDLVESGALAKRERDQSQRNVDVAAAKVLTIEQRIQAAQASINQAQANLRQVNNSVAIANEDLRDTTIAAPVPGFVGDLSVKQGDYVEQAETLGTITQNQNLSLNFFVPIEQAPQLRPNVPVELIDYRTLDTIGKGRVSFISPEVDFTSQTILAKASFDNPDNRLFTGQLVKAKVIWQQQIGVSVPVTAISRLGGETFVFVAQPNPNQEGEDAPPLIAVQTLVKLGKIEGDRYQVIEGVGIGDKIITTGILNLSDGVPILPQTEEDSFTQS